MEDSKIIQVLKALADKNRFRMVQEIAARGEISCGDVGGCFALAQPTVSHHIKILVEAGVVLVRREGQHAILSLNHEVVAQLALVPRRLRVRPRKAGTRDERRA